VLLCIYSTRYMSAEVRRVGGYVLRHTLARSSPYDRERYNLSSNYRPHSVPKLFQRPGLPQVGTCVCLSSVEVTARTAEPERGTHKLREELASLPAQK